ncbi:hypothetical protein [Burkholderia sp. MSMB617WGS]|uniref:hypothetical protein n=1 Tax=Burkholderia sp. MSMB617WGS TaxID=1637831 RepID=UPI0011AE71A7|nr:hypothetical protein [Burkholderia sp. MSMB617WGS]
MTDRPHVSPLQEEPDRQAAMMLRAPTKGAARRRRAVRALPEAAARIAGEQGIKCGIEAACEAPRADERHVTTVGIARGA